MHIRFLSDDGNFVVASNGPIPSQWRTSLNIHEDSNPTQHGQNFSVLRDSSSGNRSTHHGKRALIPSNALHTWFRVRVIVAGWHRGDS